MKKAFFNWSSGKDSALALYTILQSNTYSISILVTTVNQKFKRISMHGVDENLLKKQAESIGLPLEIIYLPEEVSMDVYDNIMKDTLKKLVDMGNEYSVFGDIFLEDLRKYREIKLADLNLKGVFPLWKQDSKAIMEKFLSLGFKAITVSVNANLLDESFVGREVDENFIKDLPSTVDVCGENGEFHTFVYDGPIFSKPINVKIGEKVLKTYPSNKNDTWDNSFWYCDLLPE